MIYTAKLVGGDDGIYELRNSNGILQYFASRNELAGTISYIKSLDSNNEVIVLVKGE